MHTSLIIGALVWIFVAALLVMFIRGAGSSHTRGRK